MYSLWIDEFSTTDPNSSGGKALFCYKLGSYFQEHGLFHVTDDRAKTADFSLNVIHIHNPNARKKVLRLDGVWHDTGKNYKEKNAGMIAAIKSCDAVVYQSQFAKNMSNAFLCKPSVPTVVIHNGSMPVDHRKPSEENIFLAISKWRPHKRLADTIESFLLADIPNSKLIVAGDIDKAALPSDKLRAYQKNQKLSFVGHVPQNVLAEYISRALASIHLCWFDACPNSVVEVLCAKVPVITNNVGGTHELVEMATHDQKLICQIDTPYDYKPVDLYHPPQIDRNKVAEAIRYCFDCRPTVDCHQVSIARAAMQYKAFLESLL